ncbi:MAG: amino acid adenylation domain-containing protein, partial [Acidobacteriota bacterium]|nr:amino acid adenylation domain-containing protein [Acidobacteriota bacterium]
MMKLERTTNSSPNIGLLEADVETAAPVRQGRDDLFAHQLFEEWARRTPCRTAVQARNRRLSFGELNERANQLAHYLRSRGAGTETLVGISLERSVEMAVAIFGVLKAGAAYLPLDPTYPRERLSFMRADARPRFLIIQEGIGSDTEDSDLNVIKIDRDWSLIDRERKTEPEIIVGPDNLAYVIHTSGSTGNPKGVMITHGNLGHYVQSLPGSVEVSDSDVYLHTASISFSSSVRQLMFPLSLGAEVIIATVDDIADPLALFKLIKERGVTAIDIVPSYWRACNHALGELAAAERDALLDNRLRLVLSASEPLYSETVRDWRKFGHPARLVNMFGQTETAGIVFTHSIRDVEEGLIVPVGRPIANTQVYVLNSRLQQVAAGETGELHVGGTGVGRGYLNHAELTAEKFVQDAFSSNPSARLYKTGDLGRIGADGAIEFLGRIDDQVKIRGHRVEPGEIETVLRKHPSVRDAIVVPDNSNGQSLIAYVVAEHINASTISGLERYQLPNGMGIVQLNEHETDFFYQQIFADQTNFRYGITLGKGDCVFDVGANIGLFTLFAHQVCPSVNVFAFEPIPEIFKALEINVSLHGNGAKLFNCGLAEREQIAEFVFYPNSTSQSGRYADEADERKVLRTIIDNVKGYDTKNAGKVGQNELLDEIVEQRVQGERVVCTLKTLSQVIREQGVERIDLLKIDVEKSELDVLGGIEESDWPKIKQIVIEAHDANGQVAEMTQLLREHGFDCIAEQDSYLRGSSLYNLYASRNSLLATNVSGNT